MNEYIDITIRTTPETAAFAKFIGNAGVLLVLQIKLLQDLAERCADDAQCFAALLEVCVLTDAVDNFVEAKNEMHAEADQLQAPVFHAAPTGSATARAQSGRI